MTKNEEGALFPFIKHLSFLFQLFLRSTFLGPNSALSKIFDKKKMFF